MDPFPHEDPHHEDPHHGRVAPLRERYRPRVVVAEDDDDFRRLLAFHLQRDGYRVTCVPTASDLLVDLEATRRGAEPPALVITDQKMPGITGLQALCRVRDWGWTVPLVLITAFGNAELASRARGLGVTMMRKPFDMDDLRTLVGYLVPGSFAGRARGCAACGSQKDLCWWDTSRSALFCRECRGLLEHLSPER